MKLTDKEVKKYMMWRTDEELMHCPNAIAAACNDMYEEYKHNEFAKITAKDFMKLLFFNDPIVGMNTHSYGFNTANGRHIINTLQNKYYEYKN
tara:strand:+ start:215 stop:493 length:279 start_codon:yes stop_codon:yes gene_type:complete